MVSMQPAVSAAASLRGFVTSTIPWNSVQHARSICVDTTRIFKGAPTLFPAQCCHARSYATNVEKELLEAKREARPYRIDVSKLSAVEREKLRLRSKAIPLVADTDALDVIFEDDLFLVVNKPSFVKMHPSHRFQGGSLLNRAIGHCGFAPFILHRLDMVRREVIFVPLPSIRIANTFHAVFIAMT